MGFLIGLTVKLFIGILRGLVWLFKKTGLWMIFVFSQVVGLGMYGISVLDGKAPVAVGWILMAVMALAAWFTVMFILTTTARSVIRLVKKDPGWTYRKRTCEQGKVEL